MGLVLICEAKLSEIDLKNHLVAVVGAGPAGLYAAQYLARHGVHVVLFNRDIRPGGLAEYAIFPDKLKMRQGLMAQFKRILRMPEIRYMGNINVGQSGDVHLDHLRQAGFQAIMVTTGAQKNNWLGLPGEDLKGVYQANDIVFHYNHLPRFSERTFDFGQQIAVIGMGNVMLDVVHYLSHEDEPSIVTAYGRRGPAEVKFDRETLLPVAGCLDMSSIRAAVDSVRSEVSAIQKDPQQFFSLLEAARDKMADCDSGLRFGMQFLRSPRRLIGDEFGRVKEIVFEINRLEQVGEEVVSRGTGQFDTVPADTVIFSIGSHVEEDFGLPVEHGHFVTSPNPRFPIDDISYEVYNPELCAECEDVFVSGWARLPGDGVVGLARKDAERGARAVLAFLAAQETASTDAIHHAIERLPGHEKTWVNLDDLENLWAEEAKKAVDGGLTAFKYGTYEEMLDVIMRSRGSLLD